MRDHVLVAIVLVLVVVEQRDRVVVLVQIVLDLLQRLLVVGLVLADHAQQLEELLLVLRREDDALGDELDGVHQSLVELAAFEGVLLLGLMHSVLAEHLESEAGLLDELVAELLLVLLLFFDDLGEERQDGALDVLVDLVDVLVLHLGDQAVDDRERVAGSLLDLVVHDELLGLLAVEDEGSEQADRHEVDLLAKRTKVDGGAFLHELDQSSDDSVLAFLGQGPADLARLLLLLSDQRHDQSQIVEENVLVLRVEQVVQDLLPVLHQEDVLDVFAVVAHVDDCHDGESRQLRSVVFLPLDDRGQGLDQVDELYLAGICVVGVASLRCIVRGALGSLLLAEELDDHSAARLLDVVPVAVVQDSDQEFRISVLSRHVELLLAVACLDEDNEHLVVHGEAVVVGHELLQLLRDGALASVKLLADLADVEEVSYLLMDYLLVRGLGNILQHLDERRERELRAQEAAIDSVREVPCHLGVPFVLWEGL